MRLRRMLSGYRSPARAVIVALLCGGGTGLISAEVPAPQKIIVKDFMFVPMSLTVEAGSTVTWMNLDDEPHTVASDTGMFRSAAMDTNETFNFRFDKPGTYHFTCSIHPKMVGTIIVR